jgi:hypothetical protein
MKTIKILRKDGGTPVTLSTILLLAQLKAECQKVGASHA